MHQPTLQIPPQLFLQSEPMWGWEHTVFFPKNGSSLIFLSHPTLCCCPAPQQLQPLCWLGNSECEPQVGRRQQDGSGWSCWCGEAAVPLSCSKRVQVSLAQGHGAEVNVWHRNHFSVFSGADWSSSCWMPTLRSTVVMPINGGIPASENSSLLYKNQIFWLKCLLLCFSSFCCLTPQVTAPIFHIPELFWLFSHQCNCRVVRAVFSTNPLLKNGKVRFIISSCWQAQ